MSVYFTLLYFTAKYAGFEFQLDEVFTAASGAAQVIGCEDRLRNVLYCVEWGVKLYSNSNSKLHEECYENVQLCDNKRRSFRWRVSSAMFQQVALLLLLLCVCVGARSRCSVELLLCRVLTVCRAQTA